jgi:SAM-dependent methyltransferase
MSNVAGWRYSERLSQHIQQKSGASVEHEALRRASANLVSPDDIAAVDDALVEFVGLSRASRHVIIEGASVVIEQFRADHPDLDCEVQHCFFEEFQTSELFDYIIMGFILEHVDDPRLILRRFRKVLKPGGKLYAAVPNGKSLNRRLGLAMGLIDDLYSLNQHDIALGHKRQYCVETFKDEIEQAGFEVKHLEGIYLKPLPLHVLQGIYNADQNFQALLEVGIDFPDLCVGILVEAEAVDA